MISDGPNVAPFVTWERPGNVISLRRVETTVDRLIDAALSEDIGSGDLTSLYFVPEERRVTAYVVAREDGVLSGTEVAEEVFRRVDPELEVEALLSDGAQVATGALVMRIEGSARSILTAERTALNFLQRLCGVATITRRYVDAIRGTNTQILDTRKTIPGFRALDKQAVADGGGTNHRMGLHDRVMVKDNHLVAEGNVEQLKAAIAAFKADHPTIEVELEADSLEQVEVFLDLEHVDYILLDNMSLEDLAKAVVMRADRFNPRLEASGGVNLETVRSIAETGVDFVSVGSLTHSVKAMDLALDFVTE